MPTMASVAMRPTTQPVWTASGNMGSENRTKPYVPILRRTAARMTEPAVGASVCASGSQVWNGNIGTLMAKAKKKPQKSQPLRDSEKNGEYCGFCTVASRVGMSNVCTPVALAELKYKARMASSMITEPASVYRKNLMAAYNRRSLPQTPMRKYIGTSITSQKT